MRLNPAVIWYFITFYSLQVLCTLLGRVTIKILNPGLYWLTLMSGRLVGRVVHVDTGALSLLVTNYFLSLISVMMTEGHGINIIRVILVTGLAALNIMSLTRVHLSLIARARSRDYLLFLVNVLPYAALLIYLGPWLLIPTVPLLLFIIEVLRGNGRSVIANVSGTTLIASSYIAWYVLMGGELTVRAIALSIVWIIYHAFSALYVESKLPFRQGIRPYYSSVLWFIGLPALVYVLYVGSGLLSLVVLVEPTVRAFLAIKEGKLGMGDLRNRIRKIGIRLLIESLALACLLIIFGYLY